MIHFLKQLKEGLDTKSKFYLLVCIFLTLVVSICTILQPLLLTEVVDTFAMNQPFFTLLILIIGAHIAARLLSEVRWFFIRYPESNLMAYMRIKYTKAILNKSPHFLKINPIGEIVNKLAYIDSTVFTLSRNIFFSILPLVINIIVLMCIVHLYFPLIYLLILLTSFSIYLTLLFKGSDYLDKKSIPAIGLYSKSVSTLSDLLSNRSLLRFYNYEDIELSKYKKSLSNYFKESALNISLRGYFGLLQALVILSAILLTVSLSAYDLSIKKLSIGNFILINTYVLQLLSPLESLSKIYREIKTGLVGIKVLDDTVSSFENMKFGISHIDIKKGIEIEFKNVSFKYPGMDRLVLENISFKIEKGEFINVVGKSGSGKSTIVALLSRLYDPTSGKILFNNIPLQELSRESLHQCFANVSQVTQIITDTVHNNLVMGQQNSDLDKKVLESFTIDKFINILPEKYNTAISTHDKRFSEGQLQRISLARGFVANKPLLMLDEVTASLDSTTEKELLKTIEKESKNKTVIFITHKVKTMPKVSTILVFDQGKLVESGTHDELLSNNGYYSELYKHG